MSDGTNEGIVQYSEKQDALARIFIALTQCSKPKNVCCLANLNADVDSPPFAVHFVPQPPGEAIGKRRP
jgi:hypothetical protein